jgi:SagB-type dehydrogenase family enzyme
MAIMLNGGLLMAKEKEIILPQPKLKGRVSLEETIFKRRSQREFQKKDLGWEEIGQLLWAGQGINARRGGYNLRTVPSAGALYPLELYALTKEGLYHYLPTGHKLEILSEKDVREELADAALGQGVVAQAALDIVICAVYERVSAKYGQRGVRYVQLEAGHAAQNIHLQAEALGLGSVPIGAFNDDEVKKCLGLTVDCEPLYIIPIGYAA